MTTETSSLETPAPSSTPAVDKTLDQIYLEAIQDKKIDKETLIKLLQDGANIYASYYAGPNAGKNALQLAEDNGAIATVLEAIAEVGEVAHGQTAPKDCKRTLLMYAQHYAHDVLIEKMAALKKEQELASDELDRALQCSVQVWGRRVVDTFLPLIRAGADFYRAEQPGSSRSTLTTAADNEVIVDLLKAIEKVGAKAISRKKPASIQSDLLAFAAEYYPPLALRMLAQSKNPKAEYNLNAALFYAAYKEQRGMFSPLIAAGADPYAICLNRGGSILKFARDKGVLSHLLAALEKNNIFNYHPPTKEEYDILGYAVIAESTELLQKLLLKPSSYDIDRALGVAIVNKYESYLEPLLLAGADLLAEFVEKPLIAYAQERGFDAQLKHAALKALDKAIDNADLAAVERLQKSLPQLATTKTLEAMARRVADKAWKFQVKTGLQIDIKAKPEKDDKATPVLVALNRRALAELLGAPLKFEQGLLKSEPSKIFSPKKPSPEHIAFAEKFGLKGEQIANLNPKKLAILKQIDVIFGEDQTLTPAAVDRLIEFLFTRNIGDAFVQQLKEYLTSNPPVKAPEPEVATPTLDAKPEAEGVAFGFVRSHSLIDLSASLTDFFKPGLEGATELQPIMPREDAPKLG